MKKVDRLSEDIGLQETKSEELGKELAFLIEEIENKKSAVVELSRPDKK
ncbi:MAG: hypothetical protein MZV64_35415 [Ignavibacteriales bacterium]|nr:hypothetical protein [Ignavibacteriales bacterium]